MCQHLQQNILSVTFLFPPPQLEAAAHHQNVSSMFFHNRFVEKAITLRITYKRYFYSRPKNT